MTVDELLARGEAHARKILLEDREGALTSFYHLVCEGGDEDIIIPCPWRDEAEKQVFLDIVRNIARVVEAIAVMFCGEAWIVEVNDPAKIEGMDPASQQPGRIEVVTIIAAVGSEIAHRVLHIVRDKPAGRIVALAEKSHSGSGIGGRLIEGILPETSGQ